jgi:hypothetical protein
MRRNLFREEYLNDYFRGLLLRDFSLHRAGLEIEVEIGVHSP